MSMVYNRHVWVLNLWDPTGEKNFWSQLSANFSLSNSENFQIAAIALHTGVMSRGMGILPAWMEDKFLPPFKGYESMGLHKFGFYII